MIALRSWLSNRFIFGLLLLTVCPLLFPKIGEQQYSYVQGLCFLSLAWIAFTDQIKKHRQTMLVRSMDVAMGVCLLALLLHVFWIKPVSLSVWRWVDAVGLFAFYVFVRLSSHREIKVLVTLFPLCFVLNSRAALFATIVITFAMLVKEAI